MLPVADESLCQPVPTCNGLSWAGVVLCVNRFAYYMQLVVCTAVLHHQNNKAKRKNQKPIKPTLKNIRCTLNPKTKPYTRNAPRRVLVTLHLAHVD